MDGRMTVGADLSCPPPIYRPVQVANKLTDGRGKPAPTVQEAIVMHPTL